MTEKRGYRAVKRGLDVILSASLLLFLWFPMLIIGCLIRIESPGGAIFRQWRVGRGGRLFRCYKFRTMVRDAPSDCPTAALAHAERYITSVGRILRRSSLDELPQLWNVLRGDMSLVGPRPLIPQEELAHLLRRRTGVDRLRPGITGLAQIRGRDMLGDVEKVRLDTRYAHRISLGEDLRILGKTLKSVARGQGQREGAPPHPTT